MSARCDHQWTKRPSFGFSLSQASRLSRSKPNSSPCMARMRASYLWWRSGDRLFCKEERLWLMIRSLDDLSPKILLKQFDRCLTRSRSLRAGSFVDISELQGRHVHESFRTSWGCKSSIFIGHRMRCHRPTRTNASFIQVSFSRSLKKHKWLISSGWSLAMSRGSFDPIHIIRLGQHREMSFLREWVGKLTLKNAWFPSFGPSTASTVCLTFRKGGHIIQHSSVIKSFPVQVRELHLMVIAKCCKDSRSILTMQVLIIRGGLANVLGDIEPQGWSIWPSAQTVLRVISCSFGISRKNWLISIAGVGRTWRVPLPRFSLKSTKKPSSPFTVTDRTTQMGDSERGAIPS
jgi:hypothetical protein